MEKSLLESVRLRFVHRLSGFDITFFSKIQAKSQRYRKIWEICQKLRKIREIVNKIEKYNVGNLSILITFPENVHIQTVVEMQEMTMIEFSSVKYLRQACVTPR